MAEGSVADRDSYVGELKPAPSTMFDLPGEMAGRCRAFDWAATPLGPVSSWSVSLRTVASAVLASRNPMLLFWGPRLVQIYNDAFRPSLGVEIGPAARHPRALGMGAAEFWTDVWHVVGTQIDGVMTRGEAVWFEDLYLPIERNGSLDDAWWTYSYSPVLDDDGRIGGTLVVCIETTKTVRARRELEAERARSAGILEAMTDGYFLLDAEFRFLAVNAAMCRHTQTVREAMIGAYIWDVFTEGRGSAFDREYIRVASTGVESHFLHEYRDDRIELIAEVDAYPAPGGGVAVFWRDVTARERARVERERLLEETQAARADAERANRAKSDFLAVMSHELRTPLNAIGGYTELLEMGVQGPLTVEQQMSIERIQRSQRHLLGLINEVLNYAKIDAGSVQFDIVDVRIHQLLASCEELITPQMRAKQLDFEVQPCRPEIVARADYDKLQQILLNLLSNAVKFTEPGGRITVDCEAAGERVILRVRDTGRGITSERLENIFEPFVQVDARLTRTQEGVGLGLAISRDLARGMGGEVTAESEIGKGSTFSVVLERGGEDRR